MKAAGRLLINAGQVCTAIVLVLLSFTMSLLSSDEGVFSPAVNSNQRYDSWLNMAGAVVLLGLAIWLWRGRLRWVLGASVATVGVCLAGLTYANGWSTGLNLLVFVLAVMWALGAFLIRGGTKAPV